LAGCKDCAQFQKELDKLKDENAYLKFELQQLKDNFYKKKLKKKKPPEDEPPKPPTKKKGGLFGHKGWFRRKPKRINKVKHITLDKCPECGSTDLTECKGTEDHIQEDIILPAVEVTLFRKRRYYCRACAKTHTAASGEELSKSYIGPQAKAMAVFLKYSVKISDRDISKMFSKMFNMKVTPSSVAGFRDQVKQEALPIYHKLLEALKESSLLHIDETGWKMNGILHWLWKLSNKRIALTHIDKSRGQKVLKDLLGKDYGGVIISDFLSAYNKIKAKAKQRCIVHLLRDLKKVLAYWPEDPEVIRYAKNLKKIFEDAKNLYKKYQGKDWDKDYYLRRRRITERLAGFYFPNPNKRILQRFAKRLMRHKEELFTFLYHKQIDYHNNHAEQQIRPDVIFRKITFQNRSYNGTQNHSVLTSILQTAKLNGLDPIQTLKDILLCADKTFVLKPAFVKTPAPAEDITALQKIFAGASPAPAAAVPP